MWTCQCNQCRNGIPAAFAYLNGDVDGDPDLDDETDIDVAEADAWWREQMVRDPRPLPDFTEMNDEIPF